LVIAKYGAQSKLYRAAGRTSASREFLKRNGGGTSTDLSGLSLRRQPVDNIKHKHAEANQGRGTQKWQFCHRVSVSYQLMPKLVRRELDMEFYGGSRTSVVRHVEYPRSTTEFIAYDAERNARSTLPSLGQIGTLPRTG